ncbi:hypothetical protein ACFE35_31345, partial [Phormidesmis priestleyi ANT.L61.2]
MTQQLSAHPHHLLVASLSNIMLDLLNQVEVAPDEAGFCLYSPVSYSYSRIGTQKRLEQVPTRGSRISILGLWQP